MITIIVSGLSTKLGPAPASYPDFSRSPGCLVGHKTGCRGLPVPTTPDAPSETPGPHTRVGTLGTDMAATFQRCQTLRPSLQTAQGALLPCQRRQSVTWFQSRNKNMRLACCESSSSAGFLRLSSPPSPPSRTSCSTAGWGVSRLPFLASPFPQPSVPRANKGQRLSL